MPHADPRRISVEIHCVDLPDKHWGGNDEIWLGIQCGKVVKQEVKLPAASVVFFAELKVETNSSNQMPNFLGPFAHGTVDDRFLYLNWGRRVGGVWIGFRRAKLPLKILRWEDLEANKIRCEVKCTDAKGGPICATVKGDYIRWSRVDAQI